jgi:predicted ThiF/HesA family dinucleotide-utilizing enzyme
MEGLPKVESDVVFVRINSRITPKQIEFIKDFAKENNLTEGEAHRIIIQYFIQNYK